MPRYLELRVSQILSSLFGGALAVRWPPTASAVEPVGSGSVHDEELGPHGGGGAVGLGTVGDLVAHPGGERVPAAVAKLRLQTSFQAKEDMALLAPVVGQVPGRVLDEAHADLPELPRPPERLAGGSGMLGR